MIERAASTVSDTFVNLSRVPAADERLSVPVKPVMFERKVFTPFASTKLRLIEPEPVNALAIVTFALAVLVLSRFRIAPDATLTAPVERLLCVALTFATSVPEVTVVPPVNVLAPLSVSAPVPF